MLSLRHALSALVLVIFAQMAHAEGVSNWRVFKISDGFPDSSSIAISIGQQGNIWVRHREMNLFSGFNGHKVRTIPAPSSGFHRVFESRIGQIWTVSADGLFEFNNNSWTPYPLKEIQQELRTNSVRNARSLSVVPLKQGHVLVLLSDRLIEFSNESWPQPDISVIRHGNDSKLGRFLEMSLARDGSLWITGENGLARLTNFIRGASAEAVWTEFIPPKEFQLRNFQAPLPDDTGVTVVAESEEKKSIVHFDGSQWEVHPSNRRNIRAAWRGYDGTFWAITISSLLSLPPGAREFKENESIAASQYLDAATEGNGVFWLATSEGLFRYAPLTWHLPTELQAMTMPAQAIAEDSDGQIWVANSSSLTQIPRNGSIRSFPFPEGIEKNFTSGETLFFSPDDSVCLEAGGRLLRFNPEIVKFEVAQRVDNARIKILGVLQDRALCLQVFEATGSHFETYDGKAFKRFAIAPPNPTIEYAFLTVQPDETIWLGSGAGVFRFHNKAWQQFSGAEGTAPDAATCFSDIGEGKIWCGARDKIWQYDGKEWSAIGSAFDRVNDIRKAHDGSIWVASNNGLFRYLEGIWSLNSSEDGLPSPVIAKVFEDKQRRLWAATTRGLSMHFPEADPDPPETAIYRLDVAPDGSSTILFGGRDKWKYTDAQQLLFSHRLDGQEWSEYRNERSITFSELSGGKHYFQVRAMDRNWNVDPVPVRLEFDMPVPWYEETRLVLIGTAGFAGILFFAGLAFNRHRKLLRSYSEVEQTVELRTKQLREANSQLLHSQKMNALGTLAAGVAHDFNNILSIIKGSAQIIESNINDEQKVKTRLDRIKTSVDQGSGIVRAMLGFSRPSQKQLTSCDINTTVCETIQLLGDRFLREIDVTLKPAKDLPSIACAKDFVQQILLNCIFNAADALNGKGEIIIQTSVLDKLPESLVLEPRKSSTYIAIAVQDGGCGIAPEVMPRIFEPFFTTKAFSSRRGTGLGLSMAYQMAKDLGAGLQVESEVGKGSTFTLILPTDSVSATLPVELEKPNAAAESTEK